ncbi:hypothetical protein AB1N83_012817 [Pleurotus pulmonarius]
MSPPFPWSPSSNCCATTCSIALLFAVSHQFIFITIDCSPFMTMPSSILLCLGRLTSCSKHPRLFSTSHMSIYGGYRLFVERSTHELPLRRYFLGWYLACSSSAIRRFQRVYYRQSIVCSTSMKAKWNQVQRPAPMVWENSIVLEAVI